MPDNIMTFCSIYRAVSQAAGKSFTMADDDSNNSQ